MCAVEAKRGCGYRRIGGLYLVGGKIGTPCDRLPLPLTICPTCSHGIKPALGFTWVNVSALVQGPHILSQEIRKFNGSFEGKNLPCPEARNQSCTFCAAPEIMGRAGLLWIGEQFYATPTEFLAEGRALGFSRRISRVPRGFVPGETYVLLAHRKAVVTTAPASTMQSSDSDEPVPVTWKKEFTPGIFYIWIPDRIEQICPESKRGSKEIEAIEKRGIQPVFVPDNDPDHQGKAVGDGPPEPQGDLFTKAKKKKVRV